MELLDVIVDYQWQIFITVEILSWVMLLLFGVWRYAFNKKQISTILLFSFVALILIEAILAIIVYKETGVISDFQIIIIIFVLYACTFGIFDFIKLDRWMRKKIGAWRGVELLTEKDKQQMAQQKNPKYMARKYRITSTIHTIAFLVVQMFFWIYGTNSIAEMSGFLSDLSWIGTENVMETPYANEPMYFGSLIWGIVFAVDFVWSWSYTFFPAKS